MKNNKKIKFVPTKRTRWVKIIDFTKIRKGGIKIDELLSYLKATH